MQQWLHPGGFSLFVATMAYDALQGYTAELPLLEKEIKSHSQQRVAIEVTFEILKQQFRRLYLVDAATFKQCCLIIMGACVLHNLCNEERDFFEELQELPDLEEI